jgi:hypothetical protein
LTNSPQLLSNLAQKTSRTYQNLLSKIEGYPLSSKVDLKFPEPLLKVIAKTRMTIQSTLKTIKAKTFYQQKISFQKLREFKLRMKCRFKNSDRDLYLKKRLSLERHQMKFTPDF